MIFFDTEQIYPEHHRQVIDLVCLTDIVQKKDVKVGSMEPNKKIADNLRNALNAIKVMVNEGNISRTKEFIGLFGEMRIFYHKYWNIITEQAYAEMLTLLKDPADVMIAAAMDSECRLLGEAALKFYETATLLNPINYSSASVASYHRKNGNIGKAREICREIEARRPGDQDALSEWLMCDISDRFWPLDYYDVLAEIHNKWAPKIYIEIGVATGKSLALTRSVTRSLGIDPETAEHGLLCFKSPENNPQLYKMTSDDFFSSKNVIGEMGLPNFDIAFIDGLHHFDQVLRDFINLEKIAGKNSVILVHDCLPINDQVASRDRTTGFWTGDVWKLIPCLMAVRPDLEITTLPVAPSGMALIRNLDSTSGILDRQYNHIVEHFDSLHLPDNWGDCCKMLNVLMDQSAFDLSAFLPSEGWQ